MVACRAFRSFPADVPQTDYVPDEANTENESAGDDDEIDWEDMENSLSIFEGGVFSGCSSLTSIRLPSGISRIVDFAFADCEDLTSITIPNQVKSIGRYAFSNCKSLTEIVLPESVRLLGNHAIEECDSMKRLVIPDSLTQIKKHAIGRCPNLTAEISHNVYAMRYCEKAGIPYVCYA